MRGLMTEHGMKPDDFLDFVHEIDHSPLTPNAALGAAIEGLPGGKLILTKGTRRHADAVLARLELDRHFDDVFDIIAAELEPKPSPQTYDRFLKAHTIDAGKAAMFEDLARNLVVPYALGMTTVLVVPEHTREVFREGGAALVPAQRDAGDFRWARQSCVVGQDHFEIRGLERCALPRSGFAGGTELCGATLRLYRARRGIDAVLRQPRRLCRFRYHDRYLGHGGFLCASRQELPYLWRRRHRWRAGAVAGQARRPGEQLLRRGALRGC